ncbi:hypothetical protein D3C78_1676730 [compost metagenome]
MFDSQHDAHAVVPRQALQAEQRLAGSHAGDDGWPLFPLWVESFVPERCDVTIEGEMVKTGPNCLVT